MAHESISVVVCGAGIAGIATAYHLAVGKGVTDVLLVDERPPLTFTSDKSTECYRNWWPGPGDAMIRLMDRSIDIMERLADESNNAFRLNRRGYLFATGDPERVADMEAAAIRTSELGAGELRYHTGNPGEPPYHPAHPEEYHDQPTGADFITDRALIREHFPYLTDSTVALLHVRRAGWLSAQQLGMYMLEQARDRGVRFLSAQVVGVETRGGKVESVCLRRGGEEITISADAFVNAAGPYLEKVGRMLGVEIPVFAELHMKVAINDHLGVVPRDAPLLIWNDPQVLPWSEEEKEALAEDERSRWLLEPFPPGVHTRPEGSAESKTILILWDYHEKVVEPVPSPELDPLYPEISLRGLSTMLPGMRAYFDRIPRPFLDGGYYVKTRENRPLIGPMPVEGSYLIGALSGYGIMSSCAAGELLAGYIVGDDLPSYAPAFSLTRYEDPEYQTLLESWEDSGQL